MAMLAEPRRKQKLSINPQGTSWSNDEGKFGQKMMERMGWSKGKGLGANEDGRVDNVKISLKNDQKGVGCSKNYSENWIAHQDDFNNLLESLKQDHGEEGGNCVNQVTSLEKKSESSRKRLHYKKFTRGKDLSSRSNHDLKCIFGQRDSKPVSGKNTPTVKSPELSGSEESKLDASHGFTTITSVSNVQEYFARKMAALKGRPLADSGEDNSVKEKQASQDLEVLEGERKRDKKKKKSKRQNKDTDIEDSSLNSAAEMVNCVELDNLDCHKLGESRQMESQQEVDTSQQRKVKKKKKKKKKDNKCQESECVSSVEMSLAESEGREEKKKSKKRKMEETVNIEMEEQLTENTSSKKKKKKKKKSSIEESGEVVTPADTVPATRKLRKKTRQLPLVIKTVCKSFKGANVASIRGYDKNSMCEKEMLKRIEDRHQLVLQRMRK